MKQEKIINKIKTVILSLLVFSSLSSVSALDLNPDKVMKKILSLPPFMVHEDGKLYMVVYQCIIDGGGQKFSLYLYNEKEKAMVCIGSFEESLFGK